MVLELLFEYGEHESSSVAQILNVVQTLNVCIEWFWFQGRFHEALFKKRQKSNQTLIQEHRKCDLHIWFFTVR